MQPELKNTIIIILQEKAQETERYMTDLIAELDQVKLEKAQLDERNQLLEKVLALSNTQRAPLPTKGLLDLVRFPCSGPFSACGKHPPPPLPTPPRLQPTSLSACQYS